MRFDHGPLDSILFRLASKRILICPIYSAGAVEAQIVARAPAIYRASVDLPTPANQARMGDHVAAGVAVLYWRPRGDWRMPP